MIEQTTKTSEGCNYGCPFCFNGKNSFKEYDLPEIRANKVILHDDAFLSRKNVLADIQTLGSVKVDGKVVYYELKQGINLKDLTPEIAEALYKARFKHIRFAWDNSYTKKNFYRVYDRIKMLEKAGYKRQGMICYILSNYYVSLVECLLKAEVMMHAHIPICNCRWRKYYHDPKIYPELWTQQEIDYFTQHCRTHNQIIKFGGFDPEIEKRLSRAKTLPSAALKGIIIADKQNPQESINTYIVAD